MFDPSMWLLSNVTWVDHLPVLNALNQVQIMGRNPMRWAIVMPADATSAVRLFWGDPPQGTAMNLLIQQTQFNYIITRRDIGDLICQPLYGITVSGSIFDVNYREVQFDPNRWHLYEQSVWKQLKDYLGEGGMM